jgi:hypothetical protein
VVIASKSTIARHYPLVPGCFSLAEHPAVGIERGPSYPHEAHEMRACKQLASALQGTGKRPASGLEITWEQTYTLGKFQKVCFKVKFLAP